MTHTRTFVATQPEQPTARRVAQLRALFPEAFVDGVFDPARLAESLAGSAGGADPSPERFQFHWAGKREAALHLGQPSHAALRPDPAASLAWDETPHVFVEGDNLDVLKLLHKSYAGGVKLIYIDPPYNTGSDFVYADTYADPVQHYLRVTGQVDDEGNATTSARETSGRLHSGWLSMMYPRLFLARQLLKHDGVIMVSIDDHEQHHLRLLMNEVFGEENFIAQLVWDKTRKNDAKLFSVGHEYILVYARSLHHLREAGTVWRESKPGAREILDHYRALQKRHGEDYAAMTRDLRAWYQELPEGHPSKKLSRYKHVDQWGPWRDRDISWPGGGGPRYDVLHPETGRPCRVPEAGWRFASPGTMHRQIALGLVVFRADHTQPPIRKAHLLPVPGALDEDGPGEDGPGDVESAEDRPDEAAGLQVMPSYLYAQAQVSVKALRKLMGAKVFEHPKDPAVLARLIRYVTPPGADDLVLDFFAGSGSTGEAVLLANREDGGQRRFLLVQLPQPTPPTSSARREGYATIADLTRERLRRTMRAMGAGAQPDAGAVPGFRAFKMAPTHIRTWSPQGREDYDAHLAASLDPLLPGWTPEALLWELAVREGFPLCADVTSRQVGGNTVFAVTQPGRAGRLLVCLDAALAPDLVTALAPGEHDLVIVRDHALSDEQACNFASQCQLKVL